MTSGDELDNLSFSCVFSAARWTIIGYVTQCGEIRR